MRYRLLQVKDDVYASFWFISFTMVLIAISSSLLFLFIDHLNILNGLKQYLQFYLSIESVRNVLGIIATSIITIISVTFSMTVLILSIASNQLGPRLLPNFMRQKSTQFVMGYFIGSFVYIIIILVLMSMEENYGASAYISELVGLLLGIGGLFVLIYFIHYICYAIQINNVLEFLVTDLKNAIDRQYPNLNSDDRESNVNKIVNRNTIPLDIGQDHTLVICSKGSGYIQAIDYDQLRSIAESYNITINVTVQIGGFVYPDLPVIKIYGRKDIANDLVSKCLATIKTGIRRTTVQDVEFAFEEICEIALRALSPGINNPYTAILCFDRIIEGLTVLANKSIPERVLVDKSGNIAVMHHVSGYSDVISIAFKRFRQQATQDLSVTLHMLKMINEFMQIKMPDEMRQSLYQQATLIYEDAKKLTMNEQDKNDLEKFYKNITN